MPQTSLPTDAAQHMSMQGSSTATTSEINTDDKDEEVVLRYSNFKKDRNSKQLLPAALHQTMHSCSPEAEHVSIPYLAFHLCGLQMHVLHVCRSSGPPALVQKGQHATRCYDLGTPGDTGSWAL